MFEPTHRYVNRAKIITDFAADVWIIERSPKLRCAYLLFYVMFARATFEVDPENETVG